MFCVDEMTFRVVYNDCRRIKDLFLYVIICHGFFFLNSSFLNVPQKKASIVRKPNNMLKTKKCQILLAVLSLDKR